MGFRPDPGGVCASDAHRHVLGHLTRPDESYGWSEAALSARVAASVPGPDVAAVLRELAADGLAERAGEAWRMTAKGFALLTGPIANEPPPGASPDGPAQISMATRTKEHR